MEDKAWKSDCGPFEWFSHRIDPWQVGLMVWGYDLKHWHVDLCIGGFEVVFGMDL